MGANLEKMHAIQIHTGERKEVRTMPPCYCCGAREDGIEFFQRRFAEETIICENKAARVVGEARYSGVVAFVTFKSIVTAQMASQVVMTEQQFKHPLEKQMIVEPAPAPESVAWKALHVTHMNRFVRCVIVNILTFLLIFFWMIPVAFASGLASFTTLSAVLPFIVPILNVSSVVKVCNRVGSGCSSQRFLL
jgi:membrane glycosyltransferase